MAGPVFSAVMSGSLRILAEPDAPTNNTLIPPRTAFRKCGKKHDQPDDPLSAWEMGQLNALLAPAAQVVSDSRRVQPGDVFLAFRGEYADGRDYIAAALELRRAPPCCGIRLMALPGRRSGRPRLNPPCPSCARAPG